jgi:hypothetical protein
MGMAMRAGTVSALGLACSLVFLSSCDGSLVSGSPGSADASYDGCAPACIEKPLLACIGAASSCAQEPPGPLPRTCWSSGAYLQTTSMDLLIDRSDGGEGPGSYSSLYAPDGALCANISFTESGGVAESSYQDANGRLLATLTGGVWTCNGQQYRQNAAGSPACVNDPQGWLALGQGCSTLDAGTCP